MKAERQSKHALCDIMAAMRAMNVRLIGLAYVKPTARAAGPTTSKQQSMRLAMAMGSWAVASMGVPDLVRPTQLDRRWKRMRGYPPPFGQVVMRGYPRRALSSGVTND